MEEPLAKHLNGPPMDAPWCEGQIRCNRSIALMRGLAVVCRDSFSDPFTHTLSTSQKPASSEKLTVARIGPSLLGREMTTRWHPEFRYSRTFFWRQPASPGTQEEQRNEGMVPLLHHTLSSAPRMCLPLSSTS